MLGRQQSHCKMLQNSCSIWNTKKTADHGIHYTPYSIEKYHPYRWVWKRIWPVPIVSQGFPKGFPMFPWLFRWSDIAELGFEDWLCGEGNHSYDTLYLYICLFMTIPIGSMVLLYMVTWIPSIYPSHVSTYTSTMDPMGYIVWFTLIYPLAI